MPKLPSFTPKQLIRKLKSIGFVEDHISGSHVIMYHETSKRRANVPFHLKDIPKGTLLSILRESGINRDELLK